jgi:hypothetical protein
MGDRELVPRIFYSVVSAGVVAWNVQIHMSVIAIALTALFVFGVSSAYQHYVLQWGLPLIQQVRWRLVTLAIWIIASIAITVWGLYSLSNFDYLQDKSTMARDFCWKMVIYLQGASMFVEGGCTRRALSRSKIL